MTGLEVILSMFKEDIPVPVNQKLKAVGKLISISKRTAVSEGKLYSEENKLLAHATATCIISRVNA